MSKAQQAKVISIIAAVFLAFAYLSVGFAACAGIPQVTESMSRNNSNFDDSPYTRDDLVALACEVRNFTIDDYSRDSADGDDSVEALSQFIMERASNSASSSSPTYQRWSQAALGAVESFEAGQPAEGIMEELSLIGTEYALDSNSISHLNDVHGLVSRIFLPLLGCASMAAFCLMAAFLMYGRMAGGKALLWSGAGAFLVMVIFVIWGSFGFDSLFAFIHSLFFENGTWTFSSDSLLIQMYPTGFWVGMGVLWVTATILLSGISFLAGLYVVKTEKGNAKRETTQASASEDAMEDKPSEVASAKPEASTEASN